MAYNKRTWLGRQGTGLNKFSIGGASPVTIVNQPDSVTQVGDALSAGNLNDLEDRIEDAFDDVDTALDTKADEQDVTNLNNAITAIDHRVSNLEQAHGSYVVSNYKDGSITPSGKGNWAVVEGLRGVSRVDNNLTKPINLRASFTQNGLTFTNNGDGSFTINGTSTDASGSYTYYAIGISACPYVSGHTYLAGIGNKIDGIVILNLGGYVTFDYALVATASASGNSNIQLKIYGGKTFNNFKVQPLFTDLNIYFNTSDLSFLGATDSAKLATIQKDYPHLLTPSDYGVRIVDSSYSGVRADSKNLINEADYSELALLTYADDYFSNTIADTRSFFQLAVQAVISGGTQTLNQKNVESVGRIIITFTTPSAKIETLVVKHNGSTRDFSARFEIDLPVSTQMTLSIDVTGYNPTVVGGVRFGKLQLEEGTTATDYTPYGAIDTLSLTFNGRSAGSVSEMYYPETGEQTKPLGFHTFDGTESWGLSSGYFQWNGLNNVIKRPSSGTEVPNLLIIGFLPCNWNKTEEKAIYVVPASQTQSNYIWIKDSSFADVASLKAFLNGKTLYYELATPDPSTFVTPIIDNTLLTEAYGRMSTVQTGTVVDGSFDMGFITL